MPGTGEKTQVLPINVEQIVDMPLKELEEFMRNGDAAGQIYDCIFEDILSYHESLQAKISDPGVLIPHCCLPEVLKNIGCYRKRVNCLQRMANVWEKLEAPIFLQKHIDTAEKLVQQFYIIDPLALLHVEQCASDWERMSEQDKRNKIQSQIRDFIQKEDLKGLKSVVFALRQSCQIDESRVLPPIEMKAHCELALRIAAADSRNEISIFVPYLLSESGVRIDCLSPGPITGRIALHYAMENAVASSIKALLDHEQRAKAVQQLLFSCNAEGGNTPKRPIDYLVNIVDGEKREKIKDIIIEATTQDGVLSTEIARILKLQLSARKTSMPGGIDPGIRLNRSLYFTVSPFEKGVHIGQRLGTQWMSSDTNSSFTESGTHAADVPGIVRG